ncbi:hypothetical protein, partial [Porphyromonas loveana]|uniref:hypothetical protein n=1 Tax=Porphyromonas loveana TaxID=1884669 RepID=UPI0035A126C6
MFQKVGHTVIDDDDGEFHGQSGGFGPASEPHTPSAVVAGRAYVPARIVAGLYLHYIYVVWSLLHDDEVIV